MEGQELELPKSANTKRAMSRRQTSYWEAERSGVPVWELAARIPTRPEG